MELRGCVVEEREDCHLVTLLHDRGWRTYLVAFDGARTLLEDVDVA